MSPKTKIWSIRVVPNLDLDIIIDVDLYEYFCFDEIICEETESLILGVLYENR